MTIRSSADWHGCPIRYGASILGDDWCLMILRDLMFKGAKHYADFLNAGEGISTNILAARLTTLETEGIIEKDTDPEHGKRFIYSLTDKGLELVPAMLEIILWANKWDKKTEVPPEFAKELQRSRTRMAKRIVRELKKSRQ